MSKFKMGDRVKIRPEVLSGYELYNIDENTILTINKIDSSIDSRVAYYFTQKSPGAWEDNLILVNKIDNWQEVLQ